jgi:hypothetical protein
MWELAIVICDFLSFFLLFFVLSDLLAFDSWKWLCVWHGFWFAMLLMVLGVGLSVDHIMFLLLIRCFFYAMNLITLIAIGARRVCRRNDIEVLAVVEF